MKPVRRCNSCGSFVQHDDRFCWSCGAEIGRGNVGADEGPARFPEEADGLDSDQARIIRRAHLAQSRGNLAEAETLIHQVLDEDPDSIPALSMLASILKARGDRVGAVAAAQRVSEVATERKAPPGAVERAREDRALIEDQVVREVRGSAINPISPIDAFVFPSPHWYRSKEFYGVFVFVGLMSLLLAVIAVLRGDSVGYVWLGGSILAAGWCYNDAESRRLSPLLWAPFVLCLGPFGLAIYWLSTH